MKFDTFLATINDWGRFQKVKYTLICLTYMLPSMMVYTYTFTAAKPEFRCMMPAEVGADEYNVTFNQRFDLLYKPTSDQCTRDQTGLSLSECQRCSLRSADLNEPLEKCDEYVFDRKYYKDTLVEEVSIDARLANDLIFLCRLFLVDDRLWSSQVAIRSTDDLLHRLYGRFDLLRPVSWPVNRDTDWTASIVLDRLCLCQDTGVDQWWVLALF